MKFKSLKRYLHLLLCVLMCVGLSSCLGKKNTAVKRHYMAFITKYNVYFNGNEHYKKTIDELDRKYEDDYSRTVYVYPVEAKQDPTAPQPQGDFTRSIEKAQKAIQIRSIKQRPQRKQGRSDAAYKEWMKRDEYNPFLHNAWMMMGRSQYMNGDFLGAASTFFYTSRHFAWLPNTVTEAQIWQAQCYISLGWLFEGEVILNRIKPDQLTDTKLRTLYDRAMADFYVKSQEWAKAIPYLQGAIKGSKGAVRNRLLFLAGQVYARTGERQAAYDCFKRVAGSSSASYRTQFNARIKQSEVYSGSDIRPEVKNLERMTRQDRNADYLDQIYYAIGNLYLSRQDTAQAIANYKLGVEKSKRSGIDKAMCNLQLGQLYFGQRKYALAQPCYAEAVPQLPKNYPDLTLLQKRSDVLDQMAVYAQNVELQDSLLRLSAMPEAQRLAVINRIIEELNKKEKAEAEERAREEHLAQAEANDAARPNQNKNTPAQFQMNTDKSWYFYNDAAKSQGRSDFQRRWGARKLEDNWRRRNKSSFDLGDNLAEADKTATAADTAATEGSAEAPALTEEQQQRASDPHYPEYYLAQIPKTDEERNTSHTVIQEGLYNLGLILKDRLEDYPAANIEFDRLLKDYPDNIYRLEVYYNRYLMAMRRGDTADAERWRGLILEHFADSPYGTALRDPQYFANLRRMDAEQAALYDIALEAYFDNRNTDVHNSYFDMQRRYPLSKLMPRFMLLHALSYATEQQADSFNLTLRTMLERYPDADFAPIAGAWAKGLAQGRQLRTQPESGNMRGLLWDVRLDGDTTATASDQALDFDLSPDKSQLLVMLFPTDQVSAPELLYEIARFNFRTFAVKDFDIETMNFGRLGMVVIRGFDNMRQLNRYRQLMGESPEFKLMPGVRPVVISAENFKRLMDGGHSFDQYFRYLDEQNYIDPQRHLLQPTEIETLPERDAHTEQDSGQQQGDAQQPQAAQGTGAPQDNARQPQAAQGTGADSQHGVAGGKPAIAAQPTAQPATPAKVQPQPATTPATPAKPQPQPTVPTYAPGSEGDDDEPVF